MKSSRIGLCNLREKFHFAVANSDAVHSFFIIDPLQHELMRILLFLLSSVDSLGVQIENESILIENY